MSDQHFDAIVLGGGIVGASTAYALTKKGQKTLLVDQFAPGHNKGSSHGDGRVVRWNYTESIYVELAKYAYDAWDVLSRDAGQPLLQKTGLVEYGPVGTEAMQVTRDVLDSHSIPYDDLSPGEASQRFPQIRFQPDTEIIYQADGAVAFATPAVTALWRLVAENGGITLADTRIEHIDIHADGVTIRGAGDLRLTADRLVMTSGGWASKLAAQIGLDLPLTVTQENLVYFPVKADVDHTIGHLPVMLDHHQVNGVDTQFYSLPIVEIQGVKAGWHHSGAVIDADDDRYEDQRIIDTLQGWVGRTYPHLDPTPLEIHKCLYTNTPDYHFILDVHPEHPHVVIGAGFSGHGFKFGPTLGDLLAGMVLGDAPPLSLDTFSLARFTDGSTLDKHLGA